MNVPVFLAGYVEKRAPPSPPEAPRSAVIAPLPAMPPPRAPLEMRVEPAPTARRRPSRRRLGGNRRHPPAKIGDRFGKLKVVALVDDDRRGDECVRVRCPRGHERNAFVFNLRRCSGCRTCRLVWGHS